MAEQQTAKKNIILTILLCIVCAAAVFLRFYKLGTVPYGYQVDEMGSAYDGWSILHYGVDRYRISFPVYFLNAGNGQNALYTYLCSASFAIFGFTPFAIRFPAALCSVLMLFAGLDIIRLVWEEDFGFSFRVPQLFFALVYLAAPYCHMAGRFGLESLLMMSFTAFVIWSLLHAVRTGSPLWFLAAGVISGLMLYTYAIAYLVMPLFLLSTLIYMIYTKKINWKNAICFVVPLAVLAFPLILEQYVNMFEKDSIRLGIFTVTRLPEYRSGEIVLSNIPENLFLTIKASVFYDWIDYNTDYRFWTFYPMSVPFIFVGLGVMCSKVMHCITARKWSGTTLVIFWFLWQMVVCSLLGEHGDVDANPNANKVNGLFFVIMLFLVYGMIYCFRNMKQIRWKRILLAVTGIAYALYFCAFLKFYYTDFHPDYIWADTFNEEWDFIQSDPKLAGRILISKSNYIYYLATVLPSPYDVDVENGEYGSVIPNELLDIPWAVTEGYGYGANYLLMQVSEERKALFDEKGYTMKEFDNGYTLFYYDGN